MWGTTRKKLKWKIKNRRRGRQGRKRNRYVSKLLVKAICCVIIGNSDSKRTLGNQPQGQTEEDDDKDKEKVEEENEKYTYPRLPETINLKRIYKLTN